MLVHQQIQKTRRALTGVFARGSFGRNVVLVGEGAAGGYLIAGLSAPIITRIYDPSDLGTAGVFVAFLSILVILHEGIYARAIPLPDSDWIARNVALFSIFALIPVFLVTVAGVWIAGDEIARWTKASELQSYLWLISIALLMGGVYQTLSYWAVRKGAYGAIGGAKFTLNGGRVITALSLGGLKGGALGLILGEIVGRMVASLRLIPIARLEGGHFLSKLEHRDLWNAAVRYRRFPMYAAPSGLLNSLHTAIPVLIFALLYGPQAAGLFTLIQRAVWAPLGLLSETVGQVYLGRASELARENPRELAILTQKVVKTLLMIVAVPLLLLAAMAPQLFSFVFGESWHEAGKYMQVLVPTLLLVLVVGPILHSLNILERQSWLLAGNGSGLLLLLGGFLVAHQFGMSAYAAVILYSAAMGTTYVVLYVLARVAISMKVQQSPAQSS